MSGVLYVGQYITCPRFWTALDGEEKREKGMVMDMSSRLEAAVMGSVVAAVSPAVIVPKMIKLMEEGYGVRKGIPQIILAGASVDDVFVIVLFSAFVFSSGFSDRPVSSG